MRLPSSPDSGSGSISIWVVASSSCLVPAFVLTDGFSMLGGASGASGVGGEASDGCMLFGWIPPVG